MGHSHPLGAWLGLALLVVWGTPWAAGAPTWDYAVIAEYPHDPSAFTQGLIVSDGLLLEGTGLYGRSELRRVDLNSGRTLASTRLPETLFGEGLARIGERLYQLTWKAGRCLIYGHDDLDLQGELTYRGEGWGLASDGTRLYMSDGSAEIRVRDPRDLRVIRRIPVSDAGRPVTRLNELEWIRGLIWANVWMTPRIAVITPGNGRVVAWLDLSELVQRQGPRANVLNGIAHDPASGHVFVTGKLWPRLYAIRPLLRPLRLLPERNDE